MSDENLKEALIKIGEKEPDLRPHIRVALDVMNKGQLVKVDDSYPMPKIRGLTGEVRHVDQRKGIAKVEWKGVEPGRPAPRKVQNIDLKYLEKVE